MTPHPMGMSYSATAEYRNSLVNFIIDRHPDFFLTLKMNRTTPVSLDYGEKALHHFMAQLDRCLLGKRWGHFPDYLRTCYVAVPEGHRAKPGLDSFYDWHCHIFLSLPPRVDPRSVVLQSLAPALWTKCDPTGTTDVQAIHEVRGAASYVTKRLLDVGSVGLEHFVVVGAPQSMAA